MKTNRVSRCVKCGGTELPEIDHVLPMTIAGQKFEFAELIGQTAENISRVENGKVAPDLRTVTILGSLLEDQENGSTATLDKLRTLRARKRAPGKIVVS